MELFLALLLAGISCWLVIGELRRRGRGSKGRRVAKHLEKRLRDEGMISDDIAPKAVGMLSSPQFHQKENLDGDAF